MGIDNSYLTPNTKNVEEEKKLPSAEEAAALRAQFKLKTEQEMKKEIIPVRTMADLQKNHPEAYKQIIMQMADQIIVQMRRDQKRLDKASKQARQGG